MVMRWKVGNNALFSQKIYGRTFSNTSENVLKTITIKNGTKLQKILFGSIKMRANWKECVVKKHQRYHKAQTDRSKSAEHQNIAPQKLFVCKLKGTLMQISRYLHMFVFI